MWEMMMSNGSPLFRAVLMVLLVGGCSQDTQQPAADTRPAGVDRSVTDLHLSDARWDSPPMDQRPPDVPAPDLLPGDMAPGDQAPAPDKTQPTPDLPLLPDAGPDGPLADSKAAPPDLAAPDSAAVIPGTTTHWAKGFGDAKTDQGHGVAVDTKGNIFITGAFRDVAASFGGAKLTNAGKWDIFLAKYDAGGKHLWSKSFGGAGQDVGSAVAVDAAGDVFLKGSYETSLNLGGGTLTSAKYAVFVARFAGADGKHLWSKTIAGDGLRGRLMAVTKAGDLVLAGKVEIQASWGGKTCVPKGVDLFMLKLAGKTGNHVWSTCHGSTGKEYPGGLALDPSGNVLVAGVFTGGTSALGGSPLTGDKGHQNLFGARYSGANGAHLWSRNLGVKGNADGHVGGVAADSKGDMVLTGYASNNSDLGGGPASRGLFALKLKGGSGAYIWSRRMPGKKTSYGSGVAVDSAGDVIVSGFVDKLGIALVHKLGGAGGKTSWSQAYGGSGSGMAAAVALAPTGHALVTGFFSKTVSFGKSGLTSKGDRDVFLVKLGP